MNGSEVVKELLSQQHVSQAELAQRAGYKAQSNVTGMLNRANTIKMANMVRMCHALGYKIQIVPETARTPKSGFEVTE